jgi:sulfatase maturation enzyme AslB (radical SAM superfamily)
LGSGARFGNAGALAWKFTMNPSVLYKATRNMLSAVEINFNRMAGWEFIPVDPRILSIETSSYCNLKCRFCAYVKKQSPKVSMTDAFFEDVVQQAVGMDYRSFELTPCTGDIFMDRHIFNKFRFLERHPEVESYLFFTNFTIPRKSDVENLFQLEKLRHLTVSIYGHDLPSFVAVTKSTETVYKRLIANLETLLACYRAKPIPLEICVRSTRDAPRLPTSDLTRLVEKFKRAGVSVRKTNVYNNWGGYITQEDVKGLAIDVTSSEAMYKNGACVKLFTSVLVMATGIVNGCACRDVDATLRIGDLNKTPLREIISARNTAYMQLIEEQQRGEFRPVCQSCDFYKSIYHKRAEYVRNGMAMQSMEEFKTRLAAAAGR